MKRTLATILILALLLSAAGCSSAAGTTPAATATAEVATDVPTVQAEATPTATADTAAATQAVATATKAAATADASAAVDTEEVATEAVATATAEPAVVDLSAYADATDITLGDPIVVDGAGASVSGNVVTVTAGGIYLLTGTLADGQVIVDSQDDGTVTLVLGGVDLTCSTSAPIYVAGAENTVIVLADGSVNRLADGATYVYADADEDEPNATLFSKDDLTISGNGALAIEANYNDAITGKDDLTITGGVITAEAVGDGIRGRDTLTISGGTIMLAVGGDGLEANNDEDADKGVITIAGGTFDITAGGDAVQAETDLIVRGGQMTLSSGGGSATPATATDDSTDTASMKGLKAGVEITIEAGTMVIDSADDAVHSNGSLTVSGGTITAASGDDGLHADATLTISGGEIDVTQSYEGIESAVIAISGGTIHVAASDDGINVAGGNDGSSVNGRPGQNTFSASGNYTLDISGGTVYVEAAGDGIDANGAITMSGGLVIVNGPTSSGNGALDYDRGFSLTGGTLVAAGSVGMAQAPDTSSTQYAMMVNLDAALSAGTMIHIESADGEDVLTFVPTKDYQSVVFSSPDLAAGETYTVYTGGSSTGAAADGLYTGGEYSGGSEAASLTLSSIITGYGAGGGGMRGPGGGGGGGGGR